MEQGINQAAGINRAEAYILKGAMGMGGELSKQKRANILEVDSHISKQVYKGGYRLPTLEDIYHIPSNIRKDYSRMSNTEKALFWLTGFALLGVAGYASSDIVKKTVDKNYEKGSKFVKEKYANVFAPAPAGIAADKVIANATVKATPQVSETPYQYSTDLKVSGSDAYNLKVKKALEEIKKINMTEHNEVMLYLEEIRSNVEGGVGKKGSTYLPENEINPSNIIHIKEHIKQSEIESLKSYYDSLGKDKGWRMELDAVKRQVDWEAEAYNYTEEQKQQRIKNDMGTYKNMYPEQYKKFISGN